MKASPVDLVGMLFRLHDSLEAAGLAHAFGGALALAWCVPEPRATADVDLNVFVPVDELDRVLAALPEGVEVTERARRLMARDGQARLWWSGVPVDVFLSTDEFHAAVGRRVVRRQILGQDLPFLACLDLTVFKAFFDRGKDWVDIEQMLVADAFAPADAIEILSRYLGPEDHRIARLKDTKAPS